MPVADAIQQAMIKSSGIRKMFEKGAELKQKHGADGVYDFTLGNPVLEPPAAFFDKLAGGTGMREQIQAGWSEDDIRASWKEGIEEFRAMRSPYLLYD